MKFLIFNIIVSFSLGYILFSKPNENFNEWIGNAKTKITQITKKEIVTSLQKATAEETTNIKIKKPDIKNIISKQIKEKNNLNFPKKNNETDIIKNIKSDHIVEKKPFNEKHNIKQIINNVILEREKNEVQKNYISHKIDKSTEIKEVKSQFMTSEQRQNALAELITDMEIYHLNGLKN